MGKKSIAKHKAKSISLNKMLFIKFCSRYADGSILKICSSNFNITEVHLTSASLTIAREWTFTLASPTATDSFAFGISIANQ